MPDDLPQDAREALADIIYRIDPEEIPLLAWRGRYRRAMTQKESKKLGRLRRQKKWKQWGRYMATLNKRRWVGTGKSTSQIAAERVLTEWLVQELNGPGGQPNAT